LTIRLIPDKGLWDRFVDDSPYALLFHKWDFLRTVEKHAGARLLPYGLYQGSQLVGICPVFRQRQLNLNFLFSPPPRTGVPYLGLAMGRLYDQVRQRRREGYLNDAVAELDGELRGMAPRFVSLTTVPEFGDVRPFLWAGYEARANYTYVIDLRQPLDEIWRGFDDNCRKNIKHCEGHRLEIRESTSTREFFDLMTARYGQQKLRFPVLSPGYVADLLAAFPDHLKLYYLYSDGAIIGHELICQYKKKMMLWMGESLIQREVPANYYLRWEFLKRAKAAGFEQFEIQGAMVRQLCGNKARFNPELSCGFVLEKKDTVGRLAEWTYQNLVKRKVLS